MCVCISRISILFTSKVAFPRASGRARQGAVYRTAQSTAANEKAFFGSPSMHVEEYRLLCLGNPSCPAGLHVSL